MTNVKEYFIIPKNKISQKFMMDRMLNRKIAELDEFGDVNWSTYWGQFVMYSTEDVRKYIQL